jgi:hypothetical protein
MGKKAKLKALETKVQNQYRLPDLKLDGTDFDTFILKIDCAFKKGLESCYQTFPAISEPIVSGKVIKSLILEYKSSFPRHYVLMLRHLHYARKVNLGRGKHLTDNNIIYND